MAARPDVCGYLHTRADGDVTECEARGDHLCHGRAERVRDFFRELLVHTKGRWARKPFALADWQWEDIVLPVFGTVRWDAEEQRYLRRYRIAWIEVARKNGKALDVNEPILTGRGWVPMGRLEPGDEVHAPDGSLVPVLATGPAHDRESYRVTLSDGRSVVASDEHEWVVVDARGKPHTLTTTELRDRLRAGARGDLAWRVPVPAALQRKPAALPLDPYLLGVWLGDGTTARGEVTTMDPEVVDGVRAAGFHTSYEYRQGLATTYGIPGLTGVLRRLGVLGDKHVPDAYLTADEHTRRQLLAGLLDTDGGVNPGTNTPRVDFCGTRRLVDDVTLLARSLGLKPGRPSRHNGSWRVTFTAHREDGLFRIARKRDALRARPERATRSATITVKAVEPVGVRTVRCIQVEGGMFLAGRDLVPTHNSELMAGIALYLLVSDDEEGAEVYGCAKDRDQAAVVFEVAVRMVQLSPVLSTRLRVNKQQKRIIDEQTASYYEVVAADAAGNLGSNPHGVVFDEVLTQPNGDLWEAMKTGMGTRSQPLMVAATTAGNDPASFAKQEHDEMVRILEDPARAPHIFAYLRNVPMDADPWDEDNWRLGNPALGTFKKIDSLRQEALEAREQRRKENSFRQFQLNQWVQSTTRYIALDEWDENCRKAALNPDWLLPELKGKRCWAGLDLSAKMDLSAWTLLFEDGTCLWRFWVPEAVVPQLDKFTDHKFGQWVKDGWITATEGDVIDYARIYDDIVEDTGRFEVVSAHYDKWSGEPVRQAIQERVDLEMFESATTYERMTQPMKELARAIKARELNHAGNPVARWQADCLEAKSPTDDPERVRPVKPDRQKGGKRIDGMVSLLLAMDGRLTNADTLPAAEIF